LITPFGRWLGGKQALGQRFVFEGFRAKFPLVIETGIHSNAI
jgi:hypothetical protein